MHHELFKFVMILVLFLVAIFALYGLSTVVMNEYLIVKNEISNLKARIRSMEDRARDMLK